MKSVSAERQFLKLEFSDQEHVAEAFKDLVYHASNPMAVLCKIQSDGTELSSLNNISNDQPSH